MAYKKLSEATLVENISEVANVLIEENDEIKRVPKSELGGCSCPEILETVGGDTLTWDGNTEGLEVATINYPEEIRKFFRISEITPKQEDFTNGFSITYTDGSADIYDNDNPLEIFDGFIIVDGCYIISFEDNIKFLLNNEGFVSIPKKGIYIYDELNNSSLKINRYTGFPKQQIKEKYLPSVGGVTILPIDDGGGEITLTGEQIKEKVLAGGIVKLAVNNNGDIAFTEVTEIYANYVSFMSNSSLSRYDVNMNESYAYQPD